MGHHTPIVVRHGWERIGCAQQPRIPQNLGFHMRVQSLTSESDFAWVERFCRASSDGRKFTRVWFGFPCLQVLLGRDAITLT